MIENPIFGGEQIQIQFDFDGFACKNGTTMGLENPEKRSQNRLFGKKQDPEPKTHADSQTHTATLSNIESPPITGPTAHGIALQFANYSSPKLLMDAVRDAIGLTLLKRQYSTDMSLRKRDPGYLAVIGASVTLARACTLASIGMVRNAEVLFR